MADINRAAKLDRLLPEVDLALGRLYLDSGQPVLALPCLERFIAAKPDHVEALSLLGQVLETTAQPRRAAAAYHKAIQASSIPQLDLYLALAGALSASGQPDAAVESLDEGIAQLGPLVTLELPAIELERKLARWESALSRLDKLAAQSERKESWLVRRAELLAAAGRGQEAMEAYRQALSAIEILSPHLRNQKATVELERTARAAGRLTQSH